MKRKKEKAFMELYEPVHDRFERFCKSRVYGEMDFKDLMHDTILIAYTKFEDLKDPKAFLSFLFGISRRVLANTKRKKSTENWYSNEEVYQVASVNDKTESKLEVRMLNEALLKLPDEQKETIILFEITGFSIKEISDLHGVGESAVKQRLVRARKKLSELLTEVSIDDYKQTKAEI